MPWITLDDEVAALRRLLDDEALVGAVNVTAPSPVQQREFARTLGRVLHRPAVIPTPLPLVRAVFGREMVTELLTISLRAEPARLLAAGFTFADPELEPALRHLLGR
jgi:NAD dependent epimerase/dehydratase family enzyme